MSRARAYATLVAAAGLAAGTIALVHARQRSERDRMHAGVLRDIAREAHEAAQAAALVVADSACPSGVCDLAETRFRDPATGRVYVPAVEGAAVAARG